MAEKPVKDSIWDKVIEMISPDSKRGLEGLTALLILTFALIFCHIFIVPLNLFENWPNWLLYLAVCVIFYMLKLLLFSRDPLYYGDPKRNKYVKAFQVQWPTRHIAQKFGLTEDKASYYWFEKIFNTWEEPNHPRHSQWERSFKRGYACRLVYYSIKFFESLLLISIVIIFLQEGLPRLFQIETFVSDISLAWRIGFIMFVALLYVVIRVTNQTSPENLTGVWRQYAEINRMHVHWIDENIKSLDDLRLNLNIKD